MMTEGVAERVGHDSRADTAAYILDGDALARAHLA